MLIGAKTQPKENFNTAQRTALTNEQSKRGGGLGGCGSGGWLDINDKCDNC